MHYQGMVPGRPFPINRLLTECDYTNQLRQKQRQEDVTPYSDLTVIKVNSVYMELVDKYYGWKGWGTLLMNAMALMMIGFGFAFLSKGVGFLFLKEMTGFYVGLAVFLVCMGTGWIAWYLARFEWAYYTHYPIRLNRRDRMVYVFRKDGSVLSVPWDDLFFTTDRDAIWWEIRGHVLADDGETVKETFALGAYSTSGSKVGLRMLRAHWEFYRRYMEEGPAAIAPYVKQALPIEGKRESFKIGYEVLISNYRHENPLVNMVLMLEWPLIALSSLARWVAMRKAKVPFWPAEIEARNVVAPDDTYCIDARINPPELR